MNRGKWALIAAPFVLFGIIFAFAVSRDGGTNLSLGSLTASQIEIQSSTGNDVTLQGATETTAGVLTAEDKRLSLIHI